jgi:hypothetical protein
MANLREYLRKEVDKIQMDTIKSCNNIDEVTSLIDVFKRMNEVIESAPDVNLSSANSTSGEQKKPRQYNRRNTGESKFTKEG